MINIFTFQCEAKKATTSTNERSNERRKKCFLEFSFYVLWIWLLLRFDCVKWKQILWRVGVKSNVKINFQMWKSCTNLISVIYCWKSFSWSLFLNNFVFIFTLKSFKVVWWVNDMVFVCNRFSLSQFYDALFWMIKNRFFMWNEIFYVSNRDVICERPLWFSEVMELCRVVVQQFLKESKTKTRDDVGVVQKIILFLQNSAVDTIIIGFIEYLLYRISTWLF